jgi:hypothetical protein
MGKHVHVNMSMEYINHAHTHMCTRVPAAI